MQNQTSKLEFFYGLLAFVGVIVTWTYNLLFIEQHGGFSLTLYLSENYANYASGSISNDILVVVIAFFVWSFLEAKKLGMKHWWVFVPLTFGVAIAFAMPLFLMLRERRLRHMLQRSTD